MTFPWPFFGARMLPGVELCEAPEASRSDLAPQLGRMLHVLHSRDVLDAVGGRLPENLTRRADMQVRVPAVRERLAELDGLWHAPRHVDALLDEARGPAAAGTESRCVTATCTSATSSSRAIASPA